MSDEAKRKKRKRKRKKPPKALSPLGVKVSDAIVTEDKPHG